MPHFNFSWKAKRIFSGLAILLLVVGLGVGVYTVQKPKEADKSKGATYPDLVPRYVALTNVSSDRFSFSYITEDTTVGKIFYGTSPNVLDQETAFDQPGKLHNLTVSGLSPSTTYYFKICSGNVCDSTSAYGLVPVPTIQGASGQLPITDDNIEKGGTPIQVQLPTFQQVDINKIKPLTGTFLNTSNGQGYGKSLVRIKMISNLTGEVTANLSGLFDYGSSTSASDIGRYWALELVNLRTADFSNHFQVSNPTNTEINVFAANDIGYYHEQGYTYSNVIDNGIPVTELNTPLEFPGNVTPAPTIVPDNTPTPTPSSGSLPTPTPTPAPTIVAPSIFPTDDAMVSSQKPDTNFGTLNYLGVSAVESSYLKFTIDKVYSSVKLRFYISGASVNTYFINKVLPTRTVEWTENAITYNNAPPVGELITSIKPNAVGWYEVDLSTIAQDIAGTNFSLVIQNGGTTSSTEDPLKIISKDSSTKDVPRLLVQ